MIVFLLLTNVLIATEAVPHIKLGMISDGASQRNSIIKHLKLKWELVHYSCIKFVVYLALVSKWMGNLPGLFCTRKKHTSYDDIHLEYPLN